jgi:hypothetical protein
MSGGVFAIARNIFEHDMFEPEPFTEREAWIWMIREAAWKPRRVRVGKKLCDLDRGQLATSMRFMAGKWQWAEARVRRFLKKLKSDAMIEVVSDALATQITICNYNNYQRVSLPSDAVDDAGTDAAATQQRRKQEDIKYIEDKKEEPLRGPAALPAKSIEAEVYAFGKKVLGKSAGGVISKLRKTCDYDDTHALSWLNQAAEKANPMEWLQAVLKASGNREYRGVEGVPVPAAPIIESKAERDYREWEDNYYRTVA